MLAASPALNTRLSPRLLLINCAKLIPENVIVLPLIAKFASATLMPQLYFTASVICCWLAFTIAIFGDKLNLNPSSLCLLRFDDTTAEPDACIDPCQSSSVVGVTECYDKRTVLLVIVFASYTPTVSLEKKRQTLSFDVLNCISKLPFAFFQKVILSTPNLSLEVTSVCTWDTEYCVV